MLPLNAQVFFFFFFLSILVEALPCKWDHILFWTFSLHGEWCSAFVHPCLVGDEQTTGLAVTVLATVGIWTLAGTLVGHISKKWLLHLSVIHVRSLRGILDSSFSFTLTPHLCCRTQPSLLPSPHPGAPSLGWAPASHLGAHLWLTCGPCICGSPGSSACVAPLGTTTSSLLVPSLSSLPVHWPLLSTIQSNHCKNINQASSSPHVDSLSAFSPFLTTLFLSIWVDLALLCLSPIHVVFPDPQTRFFPPPGVIALSTYSSRTSHSWWGAPRPCPVPSQSSPSCTLSLKEPSASAPCVPFVCFLLYPVVPVSPSFLATTRHLSCLWLTLQHIEQCLALSKCMLDKWMNLIHQYWEEQGLA